MRAIAETTWPIERVADMVAKRRNVGVSRRTIGLIISGKTWRHVGAAGAGREVLR